MQIILQALKDYGMMLADTGGPLDLGGTPDPRWDDDELHLLDSITSDQFEVVDTTGLMIDPDSGRSR
jgi:hypothetical protein